MDRVKLLEAFRDFFHYGTLDRLIDSYAVIKTESNTTIPADIDWQEEEYTFNRLFVGPSTPLAPAVASVYLDPEGQIQGKVTSQVRDFYDSIGLELPEIGSEPEDSLAYEFDVCRYLLLLIKEVPEIIEAYDEFINEHMKLWLPQFVQRGLENCGDSVAIRDVLGLINEWIKKESEMTDMSKELI
ncbi:MAG: hypothetical protein C0603_05350 [Denitrovibrio sp.]|nr:MAG: hypothetical protein C0603_05350 [Denitrovibrio sp.]